MSAPALELRDLRVGYRARGAEQIVLRGVSFAIAPGETYGLVGESGCGKSTAAFAALQALPRNGFIRDGRILIDGQDATKLDREGLRQLRLRKVSMVYQDPGRALNPSMTVAAQISEVFALLGVARDEALERARGMLEKVRIPAPGRVMAAFPHQLSGGMQQRVVIAMALAKNPSLLVLDEPTTGLDATVEAEVLDLIAALKGEFSTSVLFISHNLGIIERMCDRVGVLYAGSLVEEGAAADLLARPLHPYTMRLLRCLPSAGRRKSDGRLDTIPGFLPPPGSAIAGCVFAARCDFADALCRTTPPPVRRVGSQTAYCHHVDTVVQQGLPEVAAVPAGAAPVVTERPALRAAHVSKTYRAGPFAVRAVTDVSLTLAPGETLGLVGESGSGKTTLARLLLGLTAPDAGGVIELDGQAVAGHARQRSRSAQKALQIVFQNPDSALNRSHTVRHLIERSLSRLGGLFGRQRAERLAELVGAVRLTERHLSMRPRQLSGGLKQRVAIARAFAGTPRVVICDEPTSALDVSVQAAILNLLAELQATAGVSYIFISHDLGVVRYLSDRIAVLYLGRIMEIGPAEDVFEGPHHPYTEALLSAVPDVAQGEGGRIRLTGEMPSPLRPPPGCVFSTRCPRKIGAVCETEEPVLRDEAHAIRCHLPPEALGRRQQRQRGSAPLSPVKSVARTSRDGRAFEIHS
jgi:peptide/nickel transport system ATP-binding protein